MNRPLRITGEIMDCLTSDYPILKRENLLNEILWDYFALIDDDRLSELEDIIVNQNCIIFEELNQ
tara:strand:- start:633 stop:827 length:195 start_codon:yes stop_codon:yes gene_type:complete